MQIVFRVDASIHIGAGHVMRCLALAKGLSKQGAECTFVCRPYVGNMLAIIAESGHKAVALPACTDDLASIDDESMQCEKWLGTGWRNDARDMVRVLGGELVDWLVVDHYGIDERWEQVLRMSCKNLMVIDDLADRRHDCDLLLDQTYQRTQNEYASFISKKSRLLLGARYALLRPEFSRFRQKSLGRRKRKSDIKCILVSLGGMGTGKYLKTILDALSSIKWKNLPYVEVILGGGEVNQREVTLLVQEYSFSIEVYSSVSDMAERMVQADLAIGAGGITSWERCCLGLPAILIILAENQQMIGDRLDAAGAVISISINGDLYSNIQSAVIKCKENGALMEMSRKALAICDGNGVKLVVAEIMDYGFKRCRLR